MEIIILSKHSNFVHVITTLKLITIRVLEVSVGYVTKGVFFKEVTEKTFEIIFKFHSEIFEHI